MDDPIKMHETTANWLENEAVKYIRKFQLARTKKERDSAEKKLNEIRGRLSVEAKALKRLMGS
jgi:outer membrane protein TolC